MQARREKEQSQIAVQMRRVSSRKLLRREEKNNPLNSRRTRGGGAESPAQEPAKESSPGKNKL